MSNTKAILSIAQPVTGHHISQGHRLLFAFSSGIFAYQILAKKVDERGKEFFQWLGIRNRFLSIGFAGVYAWSVATASPIMVYLLFITTGVMAILVSRQSVGELKQGKHDPLPHWMTDMTAEAESHEEWAYCYKNDDFIRAMENVGLHPEKNSIMLIGEPGTGKSARVENLAWRIKNGQLHSHSPFREARIASIEHAELIGGTQYRGAFEERIAEMIRLSRKDPRLFFFIDEIHMVMGAGTLSFRNQNLDAANLMKKALARGDLRLIGATTPLEFQRYLEPDKAFGRRWTRYDVFEPTLTDCMAILTNKKEYLDKRYGNLKVTNGAIFAAAVFSSLLLKDRKQPDKALDILYLGCIFAVRERWEKLQETTSTEKSIEAVVDTQQVLQGILEDSRFRRVISHADLLRALELARSRSSQMLQEASRL